MASEVAYKPSISAKDTGYLQSQDTSWAKDSVTGELFKTTSINAKTIIPKIYSSAVLVTHDNFAENDENSVYIVPANKTFLLLGINLSCVWQQIGASGGAATGGWGEMGTMGVIGSEKILRGYGHDGFGTFTMCQNFVALPVFPSGTEFAVRSTEDYFLSTGGVVGYEIDTIEYNSTAL